MIFPRGKVGGAEPLGGSPSIGAQVPSHVRPGDYCLLWVASSTTTATITVPSWLTQITSGTISGANNLVMYGGFFPGTDYSFKIGCNDTTKGWLFSASFWGGVDPSNPYSFPQVQISGVAGLTFAATITNTQGQDDMSNVGVGNVLNGVTADQGGAWATSGAATDFTGTDAPYNTYIAGMTSVKRQTISDSGPRFAVLPPVLGDCTVKAGTFTVLPMTSGLGPLKSGLLARYVDSNNYVAAYYEVDNWGYTAGPPYTKLSDAVYLVVDIVVAGALAKRVVIAATALPDPWLGSFINVNKTHELSITAAGVLTYKCSSQQIVISDQTAILNRSGVLATGKAGLFDFATSGSGAYARLYTGFSAVGSAASNNPIAVVLAGMVPNADTFSFTSSPNDPVALDEQLAGSLGDGLGRALGHRYMFLPSTANFVATLTDNFESSSTDYMAIGAVGLNSADKVDYGLTTRKVNARSKQAKGTGWIFYLADTNTFEHIGRLKALGRNLNWTLNRPGTANCSIKMTDRIAKSVEVGATSIIAYRDGDAKWSGPVWTIGEGAAGNSMTIGAVGYLQMLEKRILAPGDERNARFGQVDAGVIAAHLLALENGKDPLPFTVLDVIGTQLRKRSYQRYQPIGPEITSMSDIESGYDIWIDPATRELVFWNRFEEDLTDEVSFAYGTGNVRNLNDVQRTRAADRLVNGIYPVTKTPGSSPGRQDDQTSIDHYGLYEEQASLSEVTNSDVALAYAAGELVYRSTPLQIFSLFPKQWVDGGNVPRPLQDYHIGSVVKFSAKKGSIDVVNQAARVFSLGLDIDDNGIETVSTFSTTVAG